MQRCKDKVFGSSGACHHCIRILHSLHIYEMIAMAMSDGEDGMSKFKYVR